MYSEILVILVIVVILMQLNNILGKKEGFWSGYNLFSPWQPWWNSWYGERPKRLPRHYRPRYKVYNYVPGCYVDINGNLRCDRSYYY
jgi:hypothetical protein